MNRHISIAPLYQNFRGNGGQINHQLVKTLHRLWGVECTRERFSDIMGIAHQIHVRGYRLGEGAFIALSWSPLRESLETARTRLYGTGHGLYGLLDYGLNLNPSLPLPVDSLFHFSAASKNNPHLTHDILAESDLKLDSTEFLQALDAKIRASNPSA